MPDTTAPPVQKTYQAGAWRFAALVVANALLALGPWFVRVADTGPVAAGFWRMFLPLPILAWLAWRERQAGAADRGLILLMLGAGVFFALDLASWHLGIERTRLGNATLFGNSASVILMVWGLIALRRAPTRLEGLALLAAFGGAAILLGRSLEVSTVTLIGDVLCLMAGLFYVFYLIPAQRARATMGSWTVLLLVCAAAAPMLLAIALVLGEPVMPGDAGFGPVVALAVTSQIVGQGLLVYSLKHFPPLIIGMALLVQPVIAAIVGWAAFVEVLAPPDVLGMAMVGAALVLARASGSQRKAFRNSA